MKHYGDICKIRRIERVRAIIERIDKNEVENVSVLRGSAFMD